VTWTAPSLRREAGSGLSALGFGPAPGVWALGSPKAQRQKPRASRLDLTRP
jgi:hypothetical protein